MSTPRKIVYFPDVCLEDLDAGVLVAYPRSEAHGHRYYAVPSFLIIGAAKSGTRELLKWLNEHPDLNPSHKEVNFFDEVIDIEKEWIRYVLTPHNQVSKKATHAEVCTSQTFEKSPEYMWRRNNGVPVPALVRQMMPNGKFIVILRNPTDRAYSAYQMRRRGTKLNPAKGDLGSFEDFIFRDGMFTESRTCVQAGHYAEHLKVWLEYFSRDQLLVLFSDEFRDTPFQMMEKTLRFLGVPKLDYRPLATRAERGFWVLRGHGSKAFEPAYAPMSPNMRARLDEHYAPWNQRLKEMFPTLNFPW
ncbi:MAG: sulfotransferase domain-containing protein [Myxococcota bacterium]